MTDPARVVVTGLGAVTAIGSGREEFWSALLAGESGLSPVRGFDTSEYFSDIGGEIHDFCAEDHMSSAAAAHYPRVSQLAVAGARLAWEDSGLAAESGSHADIIVGTTMGADIALRQIVEESYARGLDRVHASQVGAACDSRIPVDVLRELGLRGSGLLIPTACAAGNYAIGTGYDRIRCGRASVACVGGCDAFSRTAYVGFSRMMALTKDKVRPFDQNRTGIAISEGAGFVVLESLEHARDRGATVYAEICGFGLSCDASHMTIPDGDGLTRVIRSAINDAGADPEEVDLVCAHGTGTRANDRTECGALAQVFGDRIGSIPVFSIKSMLGHTMGAASALEAIACVLAIHDSKVPPTTNYETPDDDCPVDCVPNAMRPMKVRVALNNSFAFGGNNAATVFFRFE